MPASTQRLLVSLGRWPRRIAALACLLLAATTALLPDTSAGTDPPQPRIAASLRADEVAVPVSVGSASAAEVRSGDHVGVLAASNDTLPAALVADHLRVLAVRSNTAALADDSTTVVVVATDRAHALALARYGTRTLALILDRSPAGSPP